MVSKTHSTSLTDQDWAALDKQHLWHPFTQMEGYNPKIITSAQGCMIRDIDGKEYLDGFASLWTVNIGHGRKEVMDAVVAQMQEISYFSLFQVSNLPAIKLAAMLAEMLPGDLNRIFLTLGGSESVDTALKIARQYWRNRGQGEKFKIISRRRAYHGTGGGGTAAQGLTANRTKFEPLSGVVHINAPYRYRCHLCASADSCTKSCAADLEREILFQGPETVAAFIGEPVIGTGGVIVPDPGYWPAVQEICRKYGVLLIADEVITGFGRTGKMFGVEHWGVKPDLMTLAKGISSGYMPMGAVATTDHVFETFNGPGNEFNSGCTFDGHPACCAAAIANLEILQREQLADRAAEMGFYLHQQLQVLYRHQIVGEVRGIGLLAGIELVQDRESRDSFPPDKPVGKLVHQRAYDLGLFCRLLSGGVTIALSPPLIVSHAEIDRMVAILDQAIGEIADQVGRGDL